MNHRCNDAPPNPPELHTLRWEVRQRLTLLETSLLLLGRVNTNALTRRFGISRVQASKDLGLYRQLCPDNLEYNRFAKNYVVTDRFQPLLVNGGASELLGLLKTGLQDQGPIITLAAGLPPVEVLEPVERRADAAVIRAVCRAMLGGEQLRLLYQPMSHPEPGELLLSPHSLVYNGFRWHMRAFSEKHQQFRDYVLARIRNLPVTVGLATRHIDDDKDWNTWVTVQIAPHPKLDPAAAEAIQDDFGMEDGHVAITLRAPLIPYYLRLMRIGADDVNNEPFKQQIILANKDEVMPHVHF